MAKILHEGWDSFASDPGTVDTMNCKVCGEVMEVDRNLNEPRIWAGAMAKMSVLHDHFYCEDTGEEWHRQAYALRKAADEIPSACLGKTMNDEADAIVKDKMPTKSNWKELF